MDKHLEEKTLLGWIELIENQKLYKAVKGLSIEDQIFISYIVRENKTQQELAEKYRISQQNISKRFSILEAVCRRFCRKGYTGSGYG